MPITRRQFDLGITPAIEQLMEKVYDFLLEHKDQAFSRHELEKALQLERDPVWGVGGAPVGIALEALVQVGAVQSRSVRQESYYAFWHPVKKGSWEQQGLSRRHGILKKSL